MRLFLIAILIITFCQSCNFSEPILELDAGSEFTMDSKLGIEFADKKFVDSIFRQKQFILLGELDHGDGSSFVVKSKMIKYLHEEMGFNTLLLEASHINCFYLMNAMDSIDNIHHLSKQLIFSIWSQVEETKKLFDYIHSQSKTDNPLKVIGIDPQFSGAARHYLFMDELKKILPEEDTRSKEFKIFEEELELLTKWLQFPKKKDHLVSEKELLRIVDQLEVKVLNRVDDEDDSLWRLFFDDIRVVIRIKWYKDKKYSFARRDEQMFKNMNHYLKNHPNEKCIVWAANGHIVRKDNELTGGKTIWKGIKKFGDHIHEKFGNKSYSIGVTAYHGWTLDWHARDNELRKINMPGRNSLEYKLQNFDHALVDLKLLERNHQMDSYESQLLYANIICTSRWSNNFDGVIFVKTMQPSTRIKN